VASVDIGSAPVTHLGSPDIFREAFRNQIPDVIVAATQQQAYTVPAHRALEILIP